MKKESETWEEYLYTNQGLGVYARLYGYEPFEELFEKGIIVPYITAIRLMYTGPIDLVFMVNEQGRLVNIRMHDIFDSGSDSLDPKEILSKTSFGQWWAVEGIKPRGFDERNLKRGNVMNYFEELGLVSQKRRFEKVLNVATMKNCDNSFSDLNEDVESVLFHVCVSNFMKSLWHDKGSMYGITDAEIHRDRMFVVFEKKLIELISYEKDITNCRSAEDSFDVCKSISISSMNIAALDTMEFYFEEFVGQRNHDEDFSRARELLMNFGDVECFSPEVRTYFDLKSEES